MSDSEKENVSVEKSESSIKVERLKPTEELSVHVRFDMEDSDKVSALLENYEPEGVIMGRRFFILTLENTADRDSARETVEEKLQDTKAKIANYKKSLQQIRSEESNRKIYVTGFKDGVTEETLKEKFTEFGAIEEVAVMKSSKEGNKLYAFVKFVTKDPVEEAVKAEIEIESDKLVIENVYVRRSFRRGSGRMESDNAADKSKSVMLTNFSADANSSNLQKVTASVGGVSSFRFNNDHAIVTFETVEKAKVAIEKLNGMKVGDKNLVAIVSPKAWNRNSSRSRGRGRRGRYRGPGRGKRNAADAASEPKEGEQS